MPITAVTVERADFVSVPVTDTERSVAFSRETLDLAQIGTGAGPELSLATWRSSGTRTATR